VVTGVLLTLSFSSSSLVSPFRITQIWSFPAGFVIRETWGWCEVELSTESFWEYLSICELEALFGVLEGWSSSTDNVLPDEALAGLFLIWINLHDESLSFYWNHPVYVSWFILLLHCCVVTYLFLVSCCSGMILLIHHHCSGMIFPLHFIILNILLFISTLLSLLSFLFAVDLLLVFPIVWYEGEN